MHVLIKYDGYCRYGLFGAAEHFVFHPYFNLVLISMSKKAVGCGNDMPPDYLAQVMVIVLEGNHGVVNTLWISEWCVCLPEELKSRGFYCFWLERILSVSYNKGEKKKKVIFFGIFPRFLSLSFQFPFFFCFTSHLYSITLRMSLVAKI